MVHMKYLAWLLKLVTKSFPLNEKKWFLLIEEFFLLEFSDLSLWLGAKLDPLLGKQGDSSILLLMLWALGVFLKYFLILDFSYLECGLSLLEITFCSSWRTILATSISQFAPNSNFLIFLMANFVFWLFIKP